MRPGVAAAERLTQQLPRSHDRKWSRLVSSFSADSAPPGRNVVRRSRRGSSPYLTGSSALGVPPQPASDWPRDGQLVGGEVLRLLLQGVCGRRSGLPRQQGSAGHGEKLWTGVESRSSCSCCSQETTRTLAPGVLRGPPIHNNTADPAHWRNFVTSSTVRTENS